MYWKFLTVIFCFKGVVAQYDHKIENDTFLFEEDPDRFFYGIPIPLPGIPIGGGGGGPVAAGCPAECCKIFCMANECNLVLPGADDPMKGCIVGTAAGAGATCVSNSTTTVSSTGIVDCSKCSATVLPPNKSCASTVTPAPVVPCAGTSGKVCLVIPI